MLFWNGHEVNNTNLNMIADVDAIVDPAFGSNDGYKYSTITAALASGAKIIQVRDGASTEDVTVSTDHVTIFGVNRGDATAGARVKSLTVAASHVTIANLTSVSATTHGFAVSAASNWLVMSGCRAYSAGSDGFNVAKNQASLKFIDCFAQDCVNGYSIDAPDDANQMQDLVFRSCGAYLCDEAGFLVMSAGTGTGVHLNVSLESCYAYQNAQVASSAGFYIGANVDCNLIACRSYANGNGAATGNGYYSIVPSSTRYHSYSGCLARANNNSGFRLSAASARVGIAGGSADGNITDYLNCASSPGYDLTGTYGTNKAG